ncbi:C40 family peptidase [Zymobacter sp. IVIA_5232.4 C2]
MNEISGRERQAMAGLGRWIVMMSMLLLMAGCATTASRAPLKVTDGPVDGRRQKVIATAQRSVGVPYKLGGTSINDGVDCSGLALLAYRQAGVSLPRSSNQQYHFLPKARVAQPGDLLFFGSKGQAWHVGLYVGNNTMIHAPGKGRKVQKTSLDVAYWKSHYLGAGRLAP